MQRLTVRIKTRGPLEMSPFRRSLSAQTAAHLAQSGRIPKAITGINHQNSFVKHSLTVLFPCRIAAPIRS